MSPRKPNSSLSLIPEEHNTEAYFIKGVESYSPVSSRSSAVILYKYKKPRGMPRSRSTVATGGNEVRQRVLSARRLRIKDYQNQLSDLQKTIHELVQENRAMRIVHQRQDKALAKYEATNAELPNLLRSHEEELRYWKTRFRKISETNRQLEYQLKKKDSILMDLSDQNKLYSHLNQKKNLESRQRLTEKVKSLQIQLEEKDNDMRMLTRRMQLEMKQVKQHLLVEEKKTKSLQFRVQQLRNELATLKGVEELNPSKINTRQTTVKKKDANNPHNTKLSTRQIVDLSSSSSEQSDNESYKTSDSIASLVTSLKKSSFNNYLRAQLEKLKIRKISKIAEGQNKHRTSNSTSPESAGTGRLLPQRVKPSVHQDNNKNDDIKSEKDNFLKLPIAEHKSAQKLQMHRKQESTDVHALAFNEDLEFTSSSSEISNSPTVIHKEVNENKLPLCTPSATSRLCNAKHQCNQSHSNESLPAVAFVEPVSINENVSRPNSNNKYNIKQNGNICNIRKQISDDYKEREAFLDTFCRQANSMQGEEEPKKRNSTGTGDLLVPNNRKHKLLAALKAIDDNKSQD